MTDKKPVHIDRDMAVQAVWSQAEKRPGPYRRLDGSQFSGCVNTEVVNGETVPSCIVGSILAEMVGVENVPPVGPARHALQILKVRGLITYTPEASFVLSAAQAMQDGKEISWQAIANCIADISHYALSFVRDNEEQGENSEA